MTLEQFLTRVRRRHNDESTTNQFWSDAEIYELITDRCNEVLAIIGLLEAVDTSNTTTASTQTVAYPSDAVTIRQVEYDDDRLQRITFREAEFNRDSSNSHGFVEGLPRMWFPWNRNIYLVPVPDTSSVTIRIWYYKEHTEIDNNIQTSIDIPSVLHSRLVDGVLADMFVKDQNPQLSGFYENKWQNIHIPAFQQFKVEEDTASRFQIIGDSDTEELSDFGTK